MTTPTDPEFTTLRRLLAIKRHENPPPGFFDAFLDEFHRRQRLAALPSASVWQRLLGMFQADPLLAVRYGLAVAVVLLLAVNTAVLVRQSNEIAGAARPTATLAVSPVSMPPAVPLQLHHWTRTEPGWRPGINVQPEPYILERVSLTPVTYGTNGDF